MFNKNKKDEELENIDEVTEENEDSYDLDDEDFPKTSKELKKEAKEKAKEEKKEELAATDEILNSKSKTRTGQTFKMYKFIIKIILFAVLITFAIVLWFYQAEMLGAVYLVSGIGILFSAIIRLIPVLKTSTYKRTRFILLIQCVIHLVIGAYLTIAAFVHWNVVNELLPKYARDQILDNLTDDTKFAGLFSDFNKQYYVYFMIAFFFTLSGSYFWVTILYKEKTSKTLFWLMMISYALCVALGILARDLDGRVLIITLMVLILIGALVVGGEAGGGYYRYRKALVTERPKKEKKVEVGKEAPARNDEVDYSDIDPNTIPQDEPADDANIVS